ncbi:hypothetical protein ACTXT7_011832 [Hymenolepis weldensis]
MQHTGLVCTPNPKTVTAVSNFVLPEVQIPPSKTLADTKLFIIRILYDNTSVFRTQRLLCPYDAKPLSLMSKRAYRFPPSLYNHLFHRKVHQSSCLAQACPNKRTRASYRLPRFPLISSLPQHSQLPLSLFLLTSILVVASLTRFWSNQLLVFCSTNVVSSYSNSHELVSVVAVVSYQVPTYLILYENMVK